MSTCRFSMKRCLQFAAPAQDKMGVPFTRSKRNVMLSSSLAEPIATSRRVKPITRPTTPSVPSQYHSTKRRSLPLVLPTVSKILSILDVHHAMIRISLLVAVAVTVVEYVHPRLESIVVKSLLIYPTSTLYFDRNNQLIYYCLCTCDVQGLLQRLPTTLTRNRSLLCASPQLEHSDTSRM
ncbi:hypothetical protein BC943DRAFT_317670 [Umbelopsis sp. AD052]|nr:hypothetical protein BC943DRAFT_317670 [Umbelopsis sp. AD052]